MKSNEKMSYQKSLGEAGEGLAMSFLKREGFKIVSNNFRCAGGELDLIAQKNGELHFIEVKLRKNESFGSPLEAVDSYKQRRLTKAAHVFLYKNPQWEKSPKCFSVVSIEYVGNEPRVEFFPNAFEVEGGGYY